MVLKVRTLHENRWVSLRACSDPDEWGDEELVYAHESRCNGEIVAVLPFRYEKDGTLSFLLRSEVVPCWGHSHCINSVTGGVDPGLSIAETAMHELEEEAGFIVTSEELIPLGACRGSKTSDSVYHLFACDVSKKERGEARGDGGHLESLAHCFWSKNIHDAVDPLVPTMVLRLLHLIDSVEETG